MKSRLFGLVLGALLGVWIFFYFGYVLLTLPDVDDIGALFAAESTVIADRDGEELYRIHGEEDRTLVPLENIADTVKQATLAIEDQRFYERGCFDLRAFLRAVSRNVFRIFGAPWGQGGSTITQQFSRNAIIGSREKRITRKLKEYVLSCKLENRYSKNQILEFYLNRISYGHNAHGVEQAAHIYFAKSASGLTLAESVVLAALPQRPTYFSPYGKHLRTGFSTEGEERYQTGEIRSERDVRDEDFWIGLIGNMAGSGVYLGGRTDQILSNMEEQGFIAEEERRQALQELQTITFQRARENIRAPHFVFYVKEIVEEQFAGQFDEGFLEQGGLTIVTTLDWTLQSRAEQIIGELGKHNSDLYDAHNAALLAADRKTGQILAYAGNRDYWDEETDGRVDVVRAPRQPGSSFKPFSYAAAFLNGYSPATVLYDVPTTIGGDEPENFDGTFWGPLTIRRALGASRNVPAAKSFFLAGGERNIVPLAESMGLPSLRLRKEVLSLARGEPYEYGWPLSIGAAEVPLFEMVQGYATFARGGKFVPLRAVLRIEDRHGNILYSIPEEPEEEEVLDPRVAYMITSILSDKEARPAGFWREQLSIPGFETAGKTGTSNRCLKRAPPDSNETLGRCLELRPDNTWTLGYTPEIVAGVWAGNASGGALYPRASGLDTASHIWNRFMRGAHGMIVRPKTTFDVPEGLTSAQISELSGKLASHCTPEDRRRAELFLAERPPTGFDDSCVEVEVDKLTGLLASDECPAEAREKRSFFRPRSVLPEGFPEWERDVQRWAVDVAAGTGSIFVIDTGTGEIIRGTGAFLSFPLPLIPTEKCTLDLTPGRTIKPTVKILFPQTVASAPSFKPDIAYTVGAAVREVLYELDGRPVAKGGASELEPIIRLPRRFETSGLHTLKVTLTDSYFNAASDTVQFRFADDRSPPTVRILSPAPGSALPIGSTARLQVDIGDDSAIQRVQYLLGDTVLDQRKEGPFDLSFTVPNTPGSSVLRVVAWDGARNEAFDEIAVVIVGF